MATRTSYGASDRSAGRGGNPNLVFVTGAVTVLLALLVAYVSLRPNHTTSLLQNLPAPVIADSEQPQQSPVSASGNAVSAGQDADLKDVLAKPLEAAPVKEEPKVEQKKEEPLVTVDTAKAATPAEEPAAVEVKKQFSGPTEYTYTIKAGETLFRVASRFRNPASQIKTANSLSSDNVQVGQALKLKIQGIHKVASGEGLAAIARSYGVTVTDLKKANALTSDQLSEGQELVVPLP